MGISALDLLQEFKAWVLIFVKTLNDYLTISIVGCASQFQNCLSSTGRLKIQNESDSSFLRAFFDCHQVVCHSFYLSLGSVLSLIILLASNLPTELEYCWFFRRDIDVV